jgi:eukaryotic-like serine/threonine-protein kinase
VTDAERQLEPRAAPFGRYVLREPIARGGMGEVFRAVAKGAGGFEKPVVVKRILPQLGDSDALASMFVDEARLMSKLVHPNIVQVLDFGAGERDDYFLVMELVDGVDLRAFAKASRSAGRPIAIGLIAHVITQVLRGLHHAHKTGVGDGHGIVHRDVSPGNVLLSRVGEVKVADFGVALVTSPQRDGEPTTLAGKLGYMAPEQYRRQAVDARADVFSTGVVLYRLLTGKLPFEGDTGEERQRAAAGGDFQPASERRPDVPKSVDEVLVRTLAPSPDDRYDSARQMARALRQACEAAGEPLADADAVADAVEEVLAERAAMPPPVVALDEPGRQRELTRLDAGAFTMKVTEVTKSASGSVIGSGSLAGSVIGADRGATVHDAYRPHTTAPRIAAPPSDERDPADRSTSDGDASPRLAQAEPGRAPPRRLGALVLGTSILFLAAVGTWQLAAETESTTPIATTTASEATPPTAAPSATGASTTSQPAEVERAAPSANPLASQHPPPPPAVTATTPGPLATSTLPEPPTCTGKVLLAGKGSWWVGGGPARVQAPGQYQWPCGSYALTGTSRADGRSVSRSVTVRQDALASTRFE